MDDFKLLVTHAQGKDIEAYGELVRRFQDMAVGYAYSVLRDFELARDAAQEAFVEAWQCLATLREPAAFPSWLRRIVMKHCDRLTRGIRFATVALEDAYELADPKPDPAEAAQKSEIHERVLNAVGALPDEERVVTTLFYINGYSQAEIADFLDAPVTTVKNRLNSSRKRLKERMMNMVRTELQRSKPDEELARQVVRRICKWNLATNIPDGFVYLLYDTDDRPIAINISVPEAEAARQISELRGEVVARERSNFDIALAKILKTFGWKLRRVLITCGKKDRVRAVVEIERGKDEAQVECSPGDAINIAFRVNDFEIFLDNDVAEQFSIKAPDGRPVSPQEVWDYYHAMPYKPKPPQFRNMRAVFDALDKAPASPNRIRHALPWPKTSVPSDLVEDTTDAMKFFEEWVERCKGTDKEGVALGLMGAYYLSYWPDEIPAKAVEFLEKAAQLKPNDKQIAGDLATAYACQGRAKEAMKIIEGYQFYWAKMFANFQNIWGDRRFKELYGEPPAHASESFVVQQIPRIIDRNLRIPTEKDSQDRENSANAAVKEYEKNVSLRYGKWDRFLAQCPAISDDKRMEIEKAFRKQEGGESIVGRRRLQIIRSIANFRNTTLGNGSQDLGASRPILEDEKGHVICTLYEYPDSWGCLCKKGEQVAAYEAPMSQTFVRFLEAAGIKIEAMALVEALQEGIRAALLTSANGKRHVFLLSGNRIVAMAATAKCPLFVTDSFARKMVQCDDEGKPVSFKTTVESMLTQKDHR